MLLPSSESLSVAAEDLGVASLPRSTARRTEAMGSVSLVLETTVLATSGGETTEFTVLVDRVDDPVDAGIVADGIVAGVDGDNLIVLVGSILVDPVRVQDAETTNATSDTLLSNRAEVAGELELVDTLVLRLTVNDTLGDRALASTTTNSDTEDGEALLGLVTESMGLVSARRLVQTVELGKLTVFPGADTQKEAKS